MRQYTLAQRKSLADFFNMIAVAWFTAGIISPFFIISKTIIELLLYPIAGIILTWLSLLISLYLLKDIKS
ncbi:TPA: hypothetical protein DIS61_02455 [Patescibacteria group bacterium]|nr:MAG: hypothetical protein A2699_00130 [Candidatus Gottesmanbacteria bacterium RIFCSPHIGHO2_01_FULL_43_15]OGG28118.1 MAG: hypothetical protein A3A59_05380 [Candidatus Gottesmanbacteria bacterium RIFCSPLOWO2_01_FULL_42_10]HCM37485.1 hypothetical protein [Patescibacteria group bacterium]